MAPIRPSIALPGCILTALLLTVPSVAADLTLSVRGSSTGTDIYTTGSSSLSAPQNTTITLVDNGYLVDWQAPTVAGLQVAGYTVYRVPGPSTGGGVVVSHVSPQRTLFYDRPGAGTFIYFVTVLLGDGTNAESVPSQPVSTRDGNYPHCNVVGVYFSPPYYDAHLACLFPLP